MSKNSSVNLDIKRCIICNKPLRKGAKKYCSMKCFSVGKLGNKNRVGKKLSNDIKERISLKIKKLWENKKYAKNMKEKHLGQTAWNKGKRGFKHSEETKRKMSKSRIGSNSYLWKGGITNKNRKLRENIDYRIWRHNIFERDGYSCQMPNCPHKTTYIEVHHIVRFIDSEKLRFVERNGITLCRDCHNLTKGKEDKFKNVFNKIINQIYG